MFLQIICIMQISKLSMYTSATLYKANIWKLRHYDDLPLADFNNIYIKIITKFMDSQKNPWNLTTT